MKNKLLHTTIALLAIAPLATVLAASTAGGACEDAEGCYRQNECGAVLQSQFFCCYTADIGCCACQCLRQSCYPVNPTNPPDPPCAAQGTQRQGCYDGGSQCKQTTQYQYCQPDD